MNAEQRARAEGSATVIQVAGDYVVQPPGAGSVPPPPAAPGLPAPPAVLVGRESSVKVLTDLLDEGGGGAPVTVVAGLPGVGKSALAVATAHRAVEYGWFGDRVYFLPLHGYAPNGAVSGAQAVREMLRHLGVGDADAPPSPDGQVALYRARLASLARAGQRVLIVADDAGSVSQVRDLVPPDGTHRLLVTSRHRLVAPGFTARVVGLDELSAEPATELIAGALLRTWPEDPRPAREPEALARIAEHCGRLPLALTVAGSLLAGDPGLAAGELARQLAEARTRLETLHIEGDVPVGVRAAFDLSYARLPADQARLFRLLTVVPGPDCPTLFAHLVTYEGEPGPAGLAETAGELRPALAALVRASLLAEQPVGSGRWRMHDLVRLYALERGEGHAEEDGREAVIDRFLEGLTEVAARAAQALGIQRGPAAAGDLPSMAEAAHWFEAERAVLVATVVFAADNGRSVLGAGLYNHVAGYLGPYGYLEDALLLERSMVDAARRHGDPVLADALCNLSAALVCFTTRHLVDEAAECLMEALEMFRAVENRAGEARAMVLLGAVLQRQGRVEESTVILVQALALLQELQMPANQWTPLVGLGANLERLERWDEAVTVYRAAVTLAEDDGNPSLTVMLLRSFAAALWRTGEREEAMAVHSRALALSREAGNRSETGRLLLRMSQSLLDDGRTEEARAVCEEAAGLFAEIGQESGQALALFSLACVHEQDGLVTEQLEALERAVVLFVRVGDEDNTVGAVTAMANALTRVGGAAEGARAFDVLAEACEAVGLAEPAAEAREAAAEFRRPADGDTAEAAERVTDPGTPGGPGSTPRQRWRDRFRSRPR
ncbi:tetratricopeptide repeat protein [Streptomyces sp. NBC_01298]|uniref:tetratricopeptide repeat protein n=1 Tax=Streptomyces sp. NBC_01298 TaxID=2903817 RepID=UPI002E0DDF4F|nr:tetratricopeptide repeat protein [Streptomyces sp. NBC_01298]